MKTVVINADPKRKETTAQLMKSALKGAESVGAEVEYIDLYKYDISGCRICLICKKDGNQCKCYWRDELSQIIEKILNCDSLFVGVPIFFANPASHYMALLERLIFCTVSLKTGIAFKGKINVGLFYTVEYPKDTFEKSMRPALKQSEQLLEFLNGEVVIDTFSSITKVHKSASTEDEIKALKLKEEQLSKDLDTVFNIAAELSK